MSASLDKNQRLHHTGDGPLKDLPVEVPRSVSAMNTRLFGLSLSRTHTNRRTGLWQLASTHMRTHLEKRIDSPDVSPDSIPAARTGVTLIAYVQKVLTMVHYNNLCVYEYTRHSSEMTAGQTKPSVLGLANYRANYSQLDGRRRPLDHGALTTSIQTCKLEVAAVVAVGRAG
jgi:hypothetical protein